MNNLKKNPILMVCLSFTLVILGLTFMSCDNGSHIIGTGNPCSVVFHTGEGQGVAPFPQVVAAGNIIELPGQENMTHPNKKVLAAWKSNDGSSYKPYYRYTVKKDIEFTAQWGASTNSSPNTPDNSNPDSTEAGGNTPGTSNPSGIESVTGLANKLAWLKSNAKSDGNYVLEVYANETIGKQELTYSGKNNITITLKGVGANRIISPSSNNVLFSIGYSEVTLILDNNITLQGNRSNPLPLVSLINPAGSLVMNSGSTITGNGECGVEVYNYATFTMNGGTISGNTTKYGGGGVRVHQKSTFTMNGGTISGNTADGSSGGGVYVDNTSTFKMSGGTISGNVAWSSGGGVALSGTFTKTGGTITGYVSDAVNGNVVKKSGTVQSDKGHAVYASINKPESIVRRESTVGPGVKLSYSSNGTSSGDWWVDY